MSGREATRRASADQTVRAADRPGGPAVALRAEAGRRPKRLATSNKPRQVGIDRAFNAAELTMLRVVAVSVAIPTLFAAWAGPRISVAAQKPAVEPVTVEGCVARKTEGGEAYTPAAPGAGYGTLLLTRVVVRPQAPGRSAVPGTGPSTGNTGTIGVQPTQAPAREQSYELTGRAVAGLGPQVGKRVQVTGTLQVLPSEPPAPVGTAGHARAPVDFAHPSSARDQIAVAAFRPIGGTCPMS
jgi:hypothetical protein